MINNSITQQTVDNYRGDNVILYPGCVTNHVDVNSTDNGNTTPTWDTDPIPLPHQGVKRGIGQSPDDWYHIHCSIPKKNKVEST